MPIYKNILKTLFGRVMFTVLCLLIQLVWLIGLDYCENGSVFVRGFQCVLRLFSPLL